jgi:hypothetical protein
MTIRDEVAELAAKVGGTHRVSQFDGGLNAEITVPGKGSVSQSIEWGEENVLIGLLTQKMTERGWIEQRRRSYRLEYESGQTLTILAFDPAQAVKLAGRGQPEAITDLTTLDAVAGPSLDWVVLK